jgi:hypothetical protein
LSEGAAQRKKLGDELHPEFTIVDFVRCLEHPSILSFGDKDGDGTDDLEDKLKEAGNVTKHAKHTPQMHGNAHTHATIRLRHAHGTGEHAEVISEMMAAEERERSVDFSPTKAQKRSIEMVGSKVPAIPGISSQQADRPIRTVTANTKSKKTVV